MAAPLSEPSPSDARPLAVFDVDGVLADVRHRLHHLEARPQRWERFFRAADRDPVLEEGADRLPARYMKREVLRTLAGTRDVASVLDDHPAVVAVLEADGWPVELATWLPHSSTLQSAQEVEGRT